MRDTSKQLRLAVFALLNGNVPGYATYDEKRLVSSTANKYILLSTQQETPSNDNDSAWINTSSIDIEIVQKTGSEVSKDDIDEAANTILSILIPTPWNTPLTSGNLQFQNATVGSIISRNLSLSETESIITKVIQFSVTITQQL